MKGILGCFTLLGVPENVDFDVFKAPERGFADQSVKGPHVTTKLPDLVVLGMRKQVKNLKKTEKT